jgi:chaperonin GroES
LSFLIGHLTLINRGGEFRNGKQEIDSDRRPKTKSGIVLPDAAKEKPSEGTVVAVGTGRILDNGQKVAIEVKVGDLVIYSKYGGTEVKLDSEEYIILAERDILAIKA